MAEQHKGVKFETKLSAGKVCDYRIPELRWWCAVFHGHGLAPRQEGGSSGNLSFRLRDGGDGFIVTASGMRSKGGLKDDDFVLVESCDPGNGIVRARGMRQPSSESMMHWLIYKERKDVGAVFHGHCGDILAQAGNLRMLETRTEEQYGTLGLARSVLEVLDGGYFIILKGHGFVSLGRTMSEAGQRALTAYG